MIGLGALATWIVTAGFGFTLFGTWLARGGIRQHPRGIRYWFSLPPPYFPAALVFCHWTLAATGLVIWIAYLLTDLRTLAWITVFTLVPVATLGFSMFGRWLGSRRLKPPAMLRRPALAESRLPTIIVLSHGLFGATTIALVLLNATGFRK